MLNDDLSRWLQRELFEQVPCLISVIDRDYNIVAHNRPFEETFGPSTDRKCYRAYKKRDAPCPDCTAARTFEDGVVRVNEEEGIDCHGRSAHYVVHMAPIVDHEGRIPYIIEMSTDVTETKKLQTEYGILFDRVPCYVAVLNRDYRIVRANERLQKTFGVTTGEHCYQIYKQKAEKCANCPAEKTFNDGRTHVSRQVGISKDGKKTHYIVTSSPLHPEDGETNYIIEMAVDVTETRHLEAQLEEAHIFRERLLESAFDGLVALDAQGKVIMLNHAASALLGYSKNDLVGRVPPSELLPAAFFEVGADGQDSCVLSDTSVTSRRGESIPVRLSAVSLRKNGTPLGRAAFLQDLRKLRQLEKEKIDAERLAAVGQTVAGLAHGIKNILMGLEGGMYVMNTGISMDRRDRIESGWQILERNIAKITALIKNMLSFSKGRAVVTRWVEPADLAREVIELYKDAADRAGLVLALETPGAVAEAPLDPEGIHTCLANLVSNAFDACQMSERASCRIAVRCFDEGKDLVYEVEDTGCGMDYEVKHKVFTSFFTTKGTEGTGLGLLMTRKIVQEHGGSIAIEAAPGQGAKFRLVFPRERLPEPPSDRADQ